MRISLISLKKVGLPPVLAHVGAGVQGRRAVEVDQALTNSKQLQNVNNNNIVRDILKAPFIIF